MRSKVKNNIIALWFLIFSLCLIIGLPVLAYFSVSDLKISTYELATLCIIGLALLISILIIILVRIVSSKLKVQKVKILDQERINANIAPVNRHQINEDATQIRMVGEREELEGRIERRRRTLLEELNRRNLPGPNFPRQLPNMPSYMRPAPARFEKKINKYITLRFENNRTIIYVAGRRIIQCVHLILNIPKNEVPMYDEINSIDEIADASRRYGHVFDRFSQRNTIPPEQEFWGHCSNIQAWVEHDYDTRILMSNLSFPLLRELSRAGDPVAKRVYKEEIALRLESGYPSVVQYLLTQGYIEVFTASEFKTILEATDIIKNLSASPGMLNQFIRSCFHWFPTLIEHILLQILELKDGKSLIVSIAQRGPLRFPSFVSRRTNSPQFLNSLLHNLGSLVLKVEEDKTREDILECIENIKEICEEMEDMDLNALNRGSNYSFESVRDRAFLDRLLNLAEGDQENQDQLRARVLDRIRAQQALLGDEIDWRAGLRRPGSRCSFCGRFIPRGRDTCEWCGHRRDDDDDDFFPYPFIFRRPGGGGGSMKGDIVVHAFVKN